MAVRSGQRLPGPPYARSGRRRREWLLVRLISTQSQGSVYYGCSTSKAPSLLHPTPCPEGRFLGSEFIFSAPGCSPCPSPQRGACGLLPGTGGCHWKGSVGPGLRDGQIKAGFHSWHQPEGPQLSRSPEAALDFVVEEDLRAHLTCWYIQKYVKENPLPQYLEHLQP
ncbi:protein NATD1 isoform X1 [Mauremys mutica]|uniref:protein NATD1 isoform X1 n=1 Tax=Mauremys mutica TaxID=74926 RepID=UPI001D1349FC|nr:protein NATD1 isoform X1 [Mauremys mutica]